MMKYVGLMTFPNQQMKLSYFSYKQMIDIDWRSVQTVVDGIDNTYAYKFTKAESGEMVYIAWWNWFNEPGYSAGDTKVVSLEVGSLDSVRVTQAVPAAESGADLNEKYYQDFFATETLPVINGTVTIILGVNPVFVEVLSPTTSVEKEISLSIQEDFALLQNYPNPFSKSTNINYKIKISGFVSLKIYDIFGNVVRTLVKEIKNAGSHSVIFEADNLPLGVYYCRIQSADWTKSRVIVLIK